MAHSSQELAASEYSHTDSNEYKVNLNTPAVVVWEGQHTKLDIHFQHDRSKSTAFFKLRASLVLKALSPARSYLYVFLPPERIQSLTLDESPDPDSIPSDISKALGSSFTCIRVSLSTKADLIGPKSVNLKPKNQVEGRVLDELRSLVRCTAFSIFIPHQVLPKAKLLCTCYGICDRLLRSDPGQIDLACLYEGKGGVKVITGESDSQSRIITPGTLQPPSGDSPPSYAESGPCPPAATGPSALPASKKRRLDNSGAVELGDDLLATMRKMIREEVRVQVAHEVQKVELRLNDKLDRIVEKHTQRWSEELEGTRQEFDDKIEDDFFGVRMKLEDYIKEELTEAEERIVQHLQDTASVHLEFGS